MATNASGYQLEKNTGPRRRENLKEKEKYYQRHLVFDNSSSAMLTQTSIKNGMNIPDGKGVEKGRNSLVENGWLL